MRRGLVRVGEDSDTSSPAVQQEKPKRIMKNASRKLWRDWTKGKRIWPVRSRAVQKVAKRRPKDEFASGSGKMNRKFEAAANTLAKQNAESEPNMTAIYWFPDEAEGEIRLVELDRNTMPSGEQIRPYFFGPDPEGGVPYPSAIALILPEEKDRLQPPEEWGSWDRARKIWEAADAA